MVEVRVDDLPRPVPQVMEKVKEVGNEVGKGNFQGGEHRRRGQQGRQGRAVKQSEV
jgi:hypothetical protein